MRFVMYKVIIVGLGLHSMQVQASGQISYSEQAGAPVWTQANALDATRSDLLFDVDSTILENVPAEVLNGAWELTFDEAISSRSTHELQLSIPGACAPSLVVYSPEAKQPLNYNLGLVVKFVDGVMQIVLPFRINDVMYIGSFEGKNGRFSGKVKDIVTTKEFSASLVRGSSESKLNARAGQATFDAKPIEINGVPFVRDPLQGFMNIALVQHQDEATTAYMCYGIHTDIRERFFYTATKVDVTATDQPLTLLIQFWDFISAKRLVGYKIPTHRLESPLRYSAVDERASAFLYFPVSNL